MFAHVVAFEARYQMRTPLFAAVFALFFLLAFGATTVDQIQIGSGGHAHVNSPAALLQVVGILNVFGLFAVTAFVAGVVLRDEETGFAPIVQATRITKFPYLVGRFVGAFAVAYLVMLSVPLGVLVGSWMPWVDAEKIGPFVAGHYLYAALVVTLPAVLFMAAAFFSLATFTRSMMWTYVGVVAFMVLMVVSRLLLRDPAYDTVAGLSDPFGVSPLMQAMRYWTADERNTQLPPVAGILLANRAIWLGVAALLFAVGCARFRFEARVRRVSKPAARRTERPAPPRAVAALPQARGGTGLAQLAALTRFDMAFVFKSPAFFVLLALGLFNAWGGLSQVVEERGVRYFPVTRAVVDALGGAFGVIPFIIAVFYAGELVWRDRQQRMHELIAATPAPAWTHLVPKVLAITGVLAACWVVAALAGMGYQLAHGYKQLEPMGYLLWLIVPGVTQGLLLAVLALVVQVLVPSKPVGWGVMLVVLVAQMALGLAGWQHPLYVYGDAPPVPLSDMNGMGRFWIGRAWLHAYWLAFAAMLLLLAYGLWRRGAQDGLRARLAALPARLAGTPAALLLLAALIWLSLGGWVFYNTNVLNDYRSSNAREAHMAELERTLWPFERLPQPTITDVTLKVRLYPTQVRDETEGRYTLANRSGQPLDRVHVRWMENLQMQQLDIDGAQIEREYPAFQYRIYKLAVPMQPGEQRTMRFATVLEQRGFSADPGLTQIVANGSFLNNFDVSPMLGMSRMGLLDDRAKRRKYGLTPELRMPTLEDDAARAHHHLRRDSDWVNADLTLETDADQTPVAPGYTVSDRVADGRRTLHTRTEAPIQHVFSLQSARYAEARADWTAPSGERVPLTVFHHPAHAHNAPLMLAAMQRSLTLFAERYSPYQFKQARILEFPAYASFAQSFANTVPYSESIGFVQNHDTDGEGIDLVTYVTAHEIAHQWWAHQVIGADMQGATLLSETFAQYSALRVMEQQYGPAMMRRFLKYELDGYLRARGGELVEEVPLMRVENQGYIHYRKGAVAMWNLKELLGADTIDAALRALIARYAFQPAPYPRSIDFIALLRERAGPDNVAAQQLITDLFEHITLYDIKAEAARASARPDGLWDVRLTVQVAKRRADGRGKESEVPMRGELLDVGVFDAEPGKKGYTAANVLHLERRALDAGRTDFTFTVAKKPAYAGVDPYNTRIDRNSDDNVVKVD